MSLEGKFPAAFNRWAVARDIQYSFPQSEVIHVHNKLRTLKLNPKFKSHVLTALYELNINAAPFLSGFVLWFHTSLEYQGRAFTVSIAVHAG